jgi:hypothetical protein
MHEIRHEPFPHLFPASPVLQLDDVGFIPALCSAFEYEVFAAILTRRSKGHIKSKSFHYPSHHSLKISPFQVVKNGGVLRDHCGEVMANRSDKKMNRRTVVRMFSFPPLDPHLNVAQVQKVEAHWFRAVSYVQRGVSKPETTDKHYAVMWGQIRIFLDLPDLRFPYWSSLSKVFVLNCDGPW